MILEFWTPHLNRNAEVIRKACTWIASFVSCFLDSALAIRRQIFFTQTLIKNIFTLCVETRNDLRITWIKNLAWSLFSISFKASTRKSRLLIQKFLLLLEYRGAEADLFWKALERHCRLERRSSRVRRSRSSYGPSRVYTEGRPHSNKIREPKHASIFARCQQHNSKYDTRYEHQWIATAAHVGCVGFSDELQSGTTATAATKRDEHSQ